MSCWRTYTCDVLKNVSREIVVEALKGMGLGLNTNKHIVYGSYENREADCDGVITRGAEELSMGVVFDDGTGHLQLVGDFWATGLNSDTFQDELSQAYQKINIIQQAELNGWTVDEETVQQEEDGSISMEVYCYA